MAALPSQNSFTSTAKRKRSNLFEYRRCGFLPQRFSLPKAGSLLTGRKVVKGR